MSDEAERLYERVLVLRCQTGDEAAYRELVTRFGPRLRYFLLKLTARADRVDDLVQETWLDVLRQLPRLQDAAAFTAWLYRIAHGKAMLDGRRSGRELVATGEVEDVVDEQSEPTFSPDEAVRIHAALDQLEPRASRGARASIFGRNELRGDWTSRGLPGGNRAIANSLRKAGAQAIAVISTLRARFLHKDDQDGVVR